MLEHYTLATLGGRSCEVLGGYLELDESRVPYARGQVTIRPSALVPAADLDARNGAEVVLTVAARTPGGAGSTQIWKLYPRRITPREPGIYEVTLAGPESRMIDRRHTATASVVYTNQWRTPRKIIEDIVDRAGLTLAGGGMPAVSLDAQPDGGIILTTGDGYYDFIEPILSEIGGRVYADAQGVLHLVASDAAVTGTSEYRYTDTLIEEAGYTDRDDSAWADAVIPRYRWTVDGTEYMGIYPTVGTGTQKAIMVDIQSRPLGTKAAARYLEYAKRQGQALTITAESNPKIYPSTTARVQRRGDLYQEGRIKSVRHDFDTHLMTLDVYDLATITPF